MDDITSRLIYYPGDNLIDFKQADLDKIGRKYGVKISFKETIGRNRVTSAHTTYEQTWDIPYDQVSQTVVSISARDKESLRKSLREFITRYRSPVPIWGTMGSSKEGQEVALQVIEEDDGW